LIFDNGIDESTLDHLSRRQMHSARRGSSDGREEQEKEETAAECEPRFVSSLPQRHRTLKLPAKGFLFLLRARRTINNTYFDVLRGQRDDEERALVRQSRRRHLTSMTMTTMKNEEEPLPASFALLRTASERGASVSDRRELEG